MIILLSKNAAEISTEEIMDWLDSYKCSFRRINGEDLESDATLNIRLEDNNYVNSLVTKLNDERNIIWFRRGASSTTQGIFSPKAGYEVLGEVKGHLYNEFSIIRLHFYDILNKLDKVRWIDDYRKSSLNKLSVLKLTTEYGIKIPPTVVTNKKEIALAFLREQGRMITKPISEVAAIDSKRLMYHMETKEVFEADFETDIFYPSLFQKLIEKKIDIRVFYLDNTFYSMAIFSQRRAAAQIDFRNYSYDDPDRMVPYQLPEKLEAKLQALVDRMGYQHCSIDFIKGKDKQLYFLEVNPIGQFGMVSKPCNYHLEMKIANYLKNQHEKRA